MPQWTKSVCAKRLRLFLVAIFMVPIALSARADKPASTVKLTFATENVTVSGVRARSTVVLFGIGIGSHGRLALLTREVQSQTDSDNDGTVAFAVRQVPERSVWVAVELESGDYAIQTAGGEKPGELAMPDQAWRGGIPHLDLPRDYVEILVVRPGVAAWALRTADGGSNDADGAHNGILRLGLSRLEPVTGELKGPPFTVPRDLLVAIDPHTLDTFVSEAR